MDGSNVHLDYQQNFLKVYILNSFPQLKCCNNRLAITNGNAVPPMGDLGDRDDFFFWNIDFFTNP